MALEDHGLEIIECPHPLCTGKASRIWSIDCPSRNLFVKCLKLFLPGLTVSPIEREISSTRASQQLSNLDSAFFLHLDDITISLSTVDATCWIKFSRFSPTPRGSNSVPSSWWQSKGLHDLGIHRWPPRSRSMIPIRMLKKTDYGPLVAYIKPLRSRQGVRGTGIAWHRGSDSMACAKQKLHDGINLVSLLASSHSPPWSPRQSLRPRHH